MKHFIISIAIFISAASYAQSPRIALVIGNSHYTYGGTLRNPLNDARLLAQKLHDCGFRVIEKEDLPFAGFNAAIDEFFALIKNTGCEALFFYSGHGVQHDGENYLIPVNANLSSAADVRQQCVSLQFVLDKMGDARTKVNIIVLDACRSDPFSRSWSRDGEGEKGLATVARRPPQAFIAYATAPLMRAADGGGTNSPYSAALAKYILKPGWSIFQVFQAVSQEVKRENPEQLPWNDYSIDRDFYFTLTKAFQVSDQRPMEFLVTEDCFLLIDKKPLGEFPGGSTFQVPGSFAAGKHDIRVISKRDSAVYYDTTYEYNQHNDASDNLMMIPLNNIVRPTNCSQPFIDSVKYAMVHVEAGSFYMGAQTGLFDEGPAHKVTLPAFFISKYEITQYQWRTIMGTNPGNNKGCDNCPVENVSWNEVQEFIGKLNKCTQAHYRLPTEAEWEFAARGGTLTINDAYKFSGSQRLEKIGWFLDDASHQTHPVGGKAANALGIFDLSGNVAEWCSDWYGRTYYSAGESTNPRGPSGTEKVIRGGSWNDYDQYCRNTSRDKRLPEYKDKTIGFRIARDAAPN